MATTTARNQQDVDNMNVRQRLWDSLNYSYGKKREASDKSFAQAYSQADRQMLSRGMQRSSYGAQTLANLQKQGIDASNDIYDQQIADYENRLYQLERDEKADDQWQQQFDENKRQYEQNFQYQQGRDAVGDQQWQQQFEEGKRQYEQNFQYQQGRDAASDNQWQAQFDESVRQFNLLHPEASGGSGSSGGSGGRSGSSNTSNTNVQTNPSATADNTALEGLYNTGTDTNNQNTAKGINIAQTIAESLRTGTSIADNFKNKIADSLGVALPTNTNTTTKKTTTPNVKVTRIRK